MGFFMSSVMLVFSIVYLVLYTLSYRRVKRTREALPDPILNALSKHRVAGVLFHPTAASVSINLIDFAAGHF